MQKSILLKHSLSILLLLLLLTACKSKSSAAFSGITTSKEEALKKGIYIAPVAKAADKKNIQVKKKSSSTDLTAIEKKKKQKNFSELNPKNDEDIVIESNEINYLTEQLINNASDNLGITYRGGGTTKEGFDCSGLIYSTFKKFNIELPRSSNEMAEIGLKVDLENVKRGDLIFFINRGQNRINHVGMIVEVNDDEIKFIHSSTQSGVVISSLKEPYYKKTFTQVNRIL